MSPLEEMSAQMYSYLTIIPEYILHFKPDSLIMPLSFSLYELTSLFLEELLCPFLRIDSAHNASLFFFFF